MRRPCAALSRREARRSGRRGCCGPLEGGHVREPAGVVELGKYHEADLVLELEGCLPQPARLGGLELLIDGAEPFEVQRDLIGLELVADHHLHGRALPDFVVPFVFQTSVCLSEYILSSEMLGSSRWPPASTSSGCAPSPRKRPGAASSTPSASGCARRPPSRSASTR